MIRYFWIFLSLIFSQSMVAMNIKGNVSGFEGKFIRLYQVSDYISYKEVKLDVVKIDDKGDFELNAYLTKPALLKLKVDNISLDILALPEFKPELILTYDEELNSTRVYDKQFNVEFLNNSDAGLNGLIFEYQRIYAAFLEENHEKLVTKKILPDVLKFQQKMKEKYADAPDFFKVYIEYDLASLEDAVLGSEKKLYSQHIANKAIRYNNLAYMKFFAQFYQERFIQLSQKLDGFQLLSTVNGTQNYNKMMNIIKEHAFVDNDTIAQLFAILGMKEVYGDETFKKDKVLSMLGVLKNKSLNESHRKITENIIDELTFLKKGKSAPDFNLQNASGEISHLSDYKGKAVLLNFWSANSLACLRDMEFLKAYHQKYGDRLSILAINMDDKANKAVKFTNENELEFPVLFKDRQNDVIDKYRVVGLPLYVLIDKEGNIVQYPANGPEINLEAEIMKLLSGK